jgi:hypothetical protein
MEELPVSNSHIKSWSRGYAEKRRYDRYLIRHLTDRRDWNVLCVLQKVRLSKPNGVHKSFWEEKSRLKLDSADQYPVLANFISRSFGVRVQIERGKKVVDPRSRTLGEKIKSIFKREKLKTPKQT